MTEPPAHAFSPGAVRRLRLRAQGLVPPGDLSPAGVVERMVALQGQDLPAVLRAITIRSRPGTTVEDVRAAFDNGEIVRGWTQRGTLFATTPRDLAALCSLTARRVRHSMRRIRAEEGLDDTVIRDARAVAAEALGDGGVSRATLLDLWGRAGVPTQGQRGYHLIVLLALEGLLHWGPFAGAQQLMVATPAASGDDPLAPGPAEQELRRIARAYFATRGPATADDLAWWLGLPKTPVRKAVAELVPTNPPPGDDDPAAAGPGTLRTVTVDDAEAAEPRQMLTSAAAPAGAGSLGRTSLEPAGVTLVPGFDEIVLGYQDRAFVASKEAMRTVVPFTNGVFRPAVLLDGRLVGTWRRDPKKDEAPFELVDGIAAHDRAAIAEAVAAWPHA